MKILITGATGYVGRYLTAQIEDRHELRLADIQPPNDSRIPWVYTALGLERTAAHTPRPNATLPFFQGELLDMDYCLRIIEGVDAVIHLAASVKHEEPVECFKVNAIGTFNILEACAQHGVKRVLVASSINASGWFHCRVTNRPRNWPYLPADEAIPTDHEDAYSLSKYCNELNCQAWTNRTGMTTAVFRFAGVVPPEWTESRKGVIKSAEKWNETLACYVDLRDVVRGVQQALEFENLPAHGVYQLAAPDTTYLEPTMEIIERFRPELLKVLRRPLPGRTSLVSHDHAKKAFGFDPQHAWGDY